MLAHGIDAIRKHLDDLPDNRDIPIAGRRKMYDAAERIFTMPSGISVETISCNERPAELLRPDAGADRALLYFHGGGYVLGSPTSHRHMIAIMALASDAETLVPHYRLAPEDPFPGALEDAVAGYQMLLDRGWRPEQITIAGDSAGGGLTVSCLLKIRDLGLAQPGAAVCISPWTDMTASGASHESKKDVDPMVNLENLVQYREVYCGDMDLKDPFVSPLFADLSGLAPLLIQVGEDEILLDDAQGLHDNALAASTESHLEIWPRMFHVWHWFAEYLDEAGEAMDKMASFMKEKSPG